MTTQEVKRKLTAILSADVKGYSRLTTKDEPGTLQILNTYKEVMANFIQHHRGRVVDASGDNVLAEFASVVDAVECGLETQEELKGRNSELPENRRMEFRIGINLGDVIEEGDKIYGDGFNIAAHLESLSEAGGICISGTVYDHVKTKLNLGYSYLGKQSVKNIAEPVRVYRVLMKPGTMASSVRRWKRTGIDYWNRVHPIFKIVIAFVAAANAVWQLYPRISKSPVDVTPKEKVAISMPQKPSVTAPLSLEVAPKEKMPAPESEIISKPVTLSSPKEEVASKEKMAFPLPDMPSIAVLPFVNMSEDPKQEFICDGITEEIITALSKIHYLFVISRQSTFSYKGKPVKVKQVSEELGVRYVLEGSFRKEGEKVRITAQLIDALTGHHLWAERYERDLQDLFALQDEITLRIVTAMQVKLTDGEQVLKSSSRKQRLECYLKINEGYKYFEGFNIEATGIARRIAEETIAMCPEYPMAYILMGFVHQMEALLRIGKSPQESLEKGIEMAQKALAMDDSISMAHALLCSLYLIKGEHDKAIAEGERAVALDPGGAFAHEWYATSLNFAGRSQESIPMFQKAVRLNPLGNTGLYVNFGGALWRTDRFEEAVSAFRKALQRAPDNIFAHLGLTGTYGLMGREKEARAEAEEVLRLNPKFSLEAYAKGGRLLTKDKAQMDRFIEALRKAGLK